MGARGDDAVDPLYAVPSAPELERAITSVTGVATAEVHTSPDGRDRLRISLLTGAEPEVVAWSVAATLRERFGIALDPATIALRPSEASTPAPIAPATPASRPPPPPSMPAGPDGFAGDPALVVAARAALRPHDGSPPDPLDVDPARPRPSPRRGPSSRGPAEDAPAEAVEAAAAPGEPSPATHGCTSPPRRRAAIRELIATPEGDDLAVLATLGVAGREVVGQARGLGTRRGRWRIIALATLAAMNQLTEGRLRAEVDHVTVLTFPDLDHVTVAVTVLGDHGEERFLGAAMLRDDPDRAVMRATLDAVNRRVEPWLAAGERPA